MLGPFWKKHFNLRQCLPSCDDDPIVFIICQWQRDKTEPNVKYLTYRTVIALAFLVTWIISICTETVTGKWPIFLTNWGYTVCTLQAVLSVCMLSPSVLTPQAKVESNFKQRILKAYPAYWILNTIATPLAFGITFMYWIVIYDAKTMMFDAMNYFVHGNNSVLMFIDLWMVSHPIRILHFIYPAIFGIVYTVFSITYYELGGTSKDGSKCIYKILDWDKPLPTSFVCLGVTLFLICLHFLSFSLHIARKSLDERCCSKKQDISAMSESKTQAAYDNEAMTTDIV